jgi:hypothetical protein
MGSKREQKRTSADAKRAGSGDVKRGDADAKRADVARKRVVERVRRRLLSGGWPRLFVSFLLVLTGAAGFLTSYALLHIGLTKMAVRYPLAVLTAYCVFLLLLRLWLALRRKTTGDLDGDFDLTGIGVNPPSSGLSLGDAAKLGGGGGDFGGAGAGGGWVADSISDASSPVGNSTSFAGSSVGSSTSGGGWNLPDLGFDVDADEGCALLLIPIIAVIGLVIAMCYVVYAAPVLLAEILVDGLLLAGLYKRLKGVEPRHWLRSAVRRTLLPAMLTTALFISAGYLMQRAIPEARSIGDFWQRAVGSKDDRR